MNQVPHEEQLPGVLPIKAPYIVYVGNLPFQVNEDNLRKYYEELGVEAVRVLRFPDTNRSRGFGYVQFNTLTGLEKALASNGITWGDRTIIVNVAAAKPEPSGEKQLYTPKVHVSLDQSQKTIGGHVIGPKGLDIKQNKLKTKQRRSQLPNQKTYIMIQRLVRMSTFQQGDPIKYFTYKKRMLDHFKIMHSQDCESHFDCQCVVAFEGCHPRTLYQRFVSDQRDEQDRLLDIATQINCSFEMVGNVPYLIPLREKLLTRYFNGESLEHPKIRTFPDRNSSLFVIQGRDRLQGKLDFGKFCQKESSLKESRICQTPEEKKKEKGSDPRIEAGNWIKRQFLGDSIKSPSVDYQASKEDDLYLQLPDNWKDYSLAQIEKRYEEFKERKVMNQINVSNQVVQGGGASKCDHSYFRDRGKYFLNIDPQSNCVRTGSELPRYFGDLGSVGLWVRRHLSQEWSYDPQMCSFFSIMLNNLFSSLPSMTQEDLPPWHTDFSKYVILQYVGNVSLMVEGDPLKVGLFHTMSSVYQNCNPFDSSLRELEDVLTIPFDWSVSNLLGSKEIYLNASLKHACPPIETYLTLKVFSEKLQRVRLILDYAVFLEFL